jgi:hypothetical protein
MAKTSSDSGGGSGTTPGGGLTFNAAIGWGVLFMVLIVMTDVPATQNVALMLAILFMLSVIFKYGPAAFGTIKTVNTTVAS